MDDKVKFRRKIGIAGPGAIKVTIPKELQDFLEIEAGDEVIITAEAKSKGRFLALWKEKKEEGS